LRRRDQRRDQHRQRHVDELVAERQHRRFRRHHDRHRVAGRGEHADEQGQRDHRCADDCEHLGAIAVGRQQVVFEELPQEQLRQQYVGVTIALACPP
jgi:hypothetical protein